MTKSQLIILKDKFQRIFLAEKGIVRVHFYVVSNLVDSFE